MPHVWPFTALSAAWRRRCATTDRRAIVPVIEAFVDRAPIDWPALRASVHGGPDRALVDALQAIDAFRAPARVVSRPRESAPRPRLAWLLIAVAAIEILVSATFVLPAVIAADHGKALGQLLVALAFAASTALLGAAGARDARQVYFFGFLLCGGTSFARAALAAIPDAPPWTRLLWLEGLAPACLWQFALDFPRVDRFAHFDRVARRIAALVWGFGIAAVAASVAAAGGFVSAAAVQPLLPNHAGGLFWRGYSLAMVLAVVTIVIRVHRAPRDEQRTVARLAASLAAGTGPFLMVGIARTAIPGFEDWFLRAPPAVRFALDTLVMTTLLATPILTATAVVRDRPFDRQPRLAQAGRRLVRRLAVLSGARHRRDLTAALRALGGARGTRDVSRIVADAIARGLQASIVRVLVRRGDDFGDCLGSSLIAPRDAAFVTMLRASAQPLNLSAAGTIHGRLPEREREWLVTASIHMAAPILTRDGALAAIIVAGDSDRLINLERRDLWFAEAVAAAAAASWIDARVASSPERSPTAEPALECPQCGAIQPSMPMTCTCGASPVVASLPAQLGGFLAVRRRLGSGGMGIVYRGRDLRLDRDVALKTLPAIAPNAIARLRGEARAMAALNHNALATIYGLELWRDVPVLVCEYFPNGTLADRLARTGPLSPVEAVRLGARLARGLEYMHAGGVLHGDIKPANIGFTARNDATLLDFGLTRLAAASLADGMHHPVGGTLAYLSPEALRGEPSSPSLDLWALAMVLVECLHGRNPVACGHAVLTRAAIAAADPVSLTAPIRAFDPPLADLLTRALGPVGARFPSAGAFADALESSGDFSER